MLSSRTNSVYTSFMQSSTRSLLVGIPATAAIFALALTPWGVRLLLALGGLVTFLVLAKELGDILRGRRLPAGLP